MEVTEACKRIHEILELLPKWYEPSDSLPSEGIYFFYEEDEISPHTGKQRIVRVGTHGASRTLKARIKKDHYNGNREGSIFRKYLGSALLKQGGASEDRIREWRKRRKLSSHWREFEGTERNVSEVLRSKFFFRVVRVNSLKERKLFEEKLIATIAACPVCKPSDNWLGHFAWSEKVRKSRLWNSNFVDSSKRITEKDLERLEHLIRKTL